MNKKECPVCKNNEYFSCDVSSSDGYASLTNRFIGRISLNVCTECGCVYIDKRDLNKYNRAKDNT